MDREACFVKALGDVTMPQDDRDAEDRWFFEQGWSAALSALEDPSEGMIEAGTKAFHDTEPSKAGPARAVWAAMIKAAGGEK